LRTRSENLAIKRSKCSGSDLLVAEVGMNSAGSCFRVLQKQRFDLSQHNKLWVAQPTNHLANLTATIIKFQQSSLQGEAADLPIRSTTKKKTNLSNHHRIAKP